MTIGDQGAVALVLNASNIQETQKIMVPAPGPGQVLVRVLRTAQNPTDIQLHDMKAIPAGHIFGCDFVGTVVISHPSVTSVKSGDTIAGLLWGGEKPNLGAYCTYTLATAPILFRIPHIISLEAAATVPLASCTAQLALWSPRSLAIPRPARIGTTVLVWGGNSSVGRYAIQLAAHAGLRVVTTASASAKSALTALGAHTVVDYAAADALSQIRTAAAAAGKIRYAFDCIGSRHSTGSAGRAIGGTPGATICTVRPGKTNCEDVPEDVKVVDVVVWTAIPGETRFQHFIWPHNEADCELGRELFDALPDWLAKGVVMPNEVRLMGGLEDVEKGFEMHREGKIRGEKLVYRIAEEGEAEA